MQGGGSTSEPLPPHKFSSHDIVDLKASKAFVVQDDSEYGGASVTQELPTVRDDEPPRRDTRPPWPPRPGR